MKILCAISMIAWVVYAVFMGLASAGVLQGVHTNYWFTGAMAAILALESWSAFRRA